jgi:hypothetical protein
MGEFDEALERDKLTEAELLILETARKHKFNIFSINDKFYIYDRVSNKKILGANKDILYDFLIGKMQSGTTAERRVFSMTERKRIKDALHTYIPRMIGFIFAPNKPQVIKEGTLDYYNLFQPSFYDDKPLDAPYIFPTIEAFLKAFFNHPSEEMRWFLERLAYTIQNPEDRLPTAILLTGMQGSGKDTLKTIIERTLGHQNVFNLDQNSIESSFNSFIGKSQVIFCNEIHSWKDPNRIHNLLKNYMTNKTLTVNEKYMPPYNCRSNCALWLLATNDPNFNPTTSTDRRYMVAFQNKKLEQNLDKETFNRLMELILNPEHENETYNEFHHFYWYLKNLEITDKEFIRNPLHTNYKEQMIQANLGSQVLWGLVVEAIKNLKDPQRDSRLRSETGILEHAEGYYIKPKEMIELILSKKTEVNKFGEGKWRISYMKIKQNVIGECWFEDFTESPIRIGSKNYRLLKVKEKRLIDIIEGKDTESRDDKEDE